MFLNCVSSPPIYPVCLLMVGIFATFLSHRMSALPAKPGLRHSVSEWTGNNRQLSAKAQHERNISNVIRQEGRSLRNETNCKVRAGLGGLNYLPPVQTHRGDFFALSLCRHPGMKVTPLEG